MFKKLVLPTFLPDKMPSGYNEKYLNTKVSMAAPFVFVPSLILLEFDTIDIAAPENPTAYDPVTGIYTCPLTGYYEIILEIGFATLPVPTSPFEFGAGCVHNGVSLAILQDIRINFVNVYPAGQKLSVTYVIFANAGDTIQSAAAWVIAPPFNITLDTMTMTINAEAAPEPGFPIDFKYLLEEFSFNDMLKGLISQFNLCFETDEAAKVVTIEPKDNYFNTSRTPTTTEIKEGFYNNTQKDYSQLIDYSKKGSFDFPEIQGSFNYIYASDNDPTVDFIEGINALKIYEARFLMGSGSDASKVKTIEVPFFAKTIHILDDLAQYPDTNQAPQFALIYPVNNVLDPTATEERTNIKPRILYFAGQRTTGTFPETDGLIELFEVLGVPTANPLSFMVNYADPTGLDPNLGFDTQIINGVSSSGLLQKFYLQEMTRNDIAELRKNYVQFNSIDYLNFTHRTKAYIDGEKYIVQTLQGFNPLKDAPTQFVFFKDEFPDGNNILQIQNSLLFGVVTNLTT